MLPGAEQACKLFSKFTRPSLFGKKSRSVKLTVFCSPGPSHLSLTLNSWSVEVACSTGCFINDCWRLQHITSHTHACKHKETKERTNRHTHMHTNYNLIIMNS